MLLRKDKRQERKKRHCPGIGWTAFFAVFCLSCHFHAMKEKQEACTDLLVTIDRLEVTKKAALDEREDLTLQINSQQDRNWVEMVLKKRLGVVPEGQMKVYFK